MTNSFFIICFIILYSLIFFENVVGLESTIITTTGLTILTNNPTIINSTTSSTNKNENNVRMSSHFKKTILSKIRLEHCCFFLIILFLNYTYMWHLSFQNYSLIFFFFSFWDKVDEIGLLDFREGKVGRIMVFFHPPPPPPKKKNKNKKKQESSILDVFVIQN